MTRPALVLVHGWGLGPQSWQPLIPYLERDFQVYNLALPGHDGTPACGGSLAAWADHLLDRAPSRAIWLGSSLGGLLATTISLRNPECCEALVTIATNPCFVRRNDWPLAMSRDTFREFQTAVALDPVAAQNRFMHLATRGSTRPRANLAMLRGLLDDRAGVPGEVLEAGLQILLDTDLRDRVHDIAVPALHVFAERDALVPATAAVFFDTAPGQRAVTCKAGSHLPWLDEPERVAALVRDTRGRHAA